MFSERRKGLETLLVQVCLVLASQTATFFTKSCVDHTYHVIAFRIRQQRRRLGHTIVVLGYK